MISVVIATYNGEKYLKQQIDSILNQSRKPDEILISDDCSTDATMNIIREFADKNLIIKYFQNEVNQGFAQNFWNLIHKAKGDYIFLADQDDLWDENKIQEMIRVFESNDSILALNTAYNYIDARGDEIRDYRLTRFKNDNKIKQVSLCEFIKSPRYVGMAMAIKKDLLALVKAENIQQVHAHDWCLNHTAASKGGMFFWNRILSSYRQHENNTFGTNVCTRTNELSLRRLKIIDEELVMSGILLEMYKASKELSYIRIHDHVLRKRRELFLKGRKISLIVQFLSCKKYLDSRDLLGDEYALLRAPKIKK